MNLPRRASDIRIDASAPVPPMRSTVASRTDAAYEVRLQHVQWRAPGRAKVTTGSRCVLELLLPVAPAEDEAQYIVNGERGARQAVGQVNFVVPRSELDLAWTGGHVRSIVCQLDPSRLGPLSGLAWDWDDVDPMAALDIRNPRLEVAMRWLLDELLQPSFASELQMQSLLTMVALETRSHFGARAAPAATAPGKLGSRQLARIKELLEQSPAEGVSLEEIAAAVGLPARELATRFKRTLGVTLRSYVASTHIEQAKLLLTDRQLMVKQIAWRSGFDSAAAFSAAFRKATGQTPLQYRERCGSA